MIEATTFFLIPCCIDCSFSVPCESVLARIILLRIVPVVIRPIFIAMAQTFMLLSGEISPIFIFSYPLSGLLNRANGH